MVSPRQMGLSIIDQYVCQFSINIFQQSENISLRPRNQKMLILAPINTTHEETQVNYHEPSMSFLGSVLIGLFAIVPRAQDRAVHVCNCSSAPFLENGAALGKT